MSFGESYNHFQWLENLPPPELSGPFKTPSLPSTYVLKMKISQSRFLYLILQDVTERNQSLKVQLQSPRQLHRYWVGPQSRLQLSPPQIQLRQTPTRRNVDQDDLQAVLNKVSSNNVYSNNNSSKFKTFNLVILSKLARTTGH